MTWIRWFAFFAAAFCLAAAETPSPSLLVLNKEDATLVIGCGDFLNDYEGITGYEEYRSNLVLMYFVTLGAGTGESLDLTISPLEIKRFRLRTPLRLPENTVCELAGGSLTSRVVEPTGDSP